MEKNNDSDTEFDHLAADYSKVHRDNIEITGESPDYFHEYKIKDLNKLVELKKLNNSNILDFGSGIGNSIPFFRKYFPESNLSCSDVSSTSIELSKKRFDGNEKYFQITNTLPLEDCSQDIVFSACVFHHIPHSEHSHWLTEILRVTKPGGIIAIYEHNPFNPLTLHAVNTCPLDENAVLIKGRSMKKRALNNKWKSAQVDYKVFFPSFLSALRPLEPYMSWLFLGAQYRMVAIK
jgi:ubiquinone/menaquinone biosynthesis C-methylase UbiE